MRSRLARMGVVAIGLLALVGSQAPPAQAATILAAALTGTATLDGPLGYPCIGPGPGPGGTTTVGSPDPLLCPTNKLLQIHPTNGDITPTALTVTLTLLTRLPNGSHQTTTQVFPRIHHNQRIVLVVGPATCVDVAANITKPGKAPTHAGSCTFGLTTGPLLNTVAGNCGISTGQVAVTFTDALGQTFTLDVHFTALGGVLAIHGHWKKVTGTPTQQGLLIGVVAAVPPTPTDGSGTSCANKTARVFQLAGAVAAA